jgi:hypothetical protein
VKACIQPILPAAATFHSLPFAGMIAFFGLYAGVVNNRSLPRYVRFNTMQVRYTHAAQHAMFKPKALVPEH